MFIRCIFVFLSFSIFAQTQLENSHVVFESSDVVAINSLGNILELKNGSLLMNSFRYHNTLLGEISQIDASNALINWVFYKDFQTAIQLDNTLSPIQKIQFDDAYISFIGSASENRLWRINSDTNQLEMYFIKNQNSIPLYTSFSEPVTGFSSSQEFCWVQTASTLFLFNTYGSLLKKISFSGTDSLSFDGKTLLAQNIKGWFSFSHKFDNEPQFLDIEKYLPKRVFLSGNYFYIYDGNRVFKTTLPN